MGDSPAPAGEEEVSARRLADARDRLARAAAGGGPLRAAYLEARRALRVPEGVGPRAEQVEGALAAADARLLSAWLASLPREERAALGPRVRMLAGSRRPGESRRAHRKSLRAHLIDLAGRAGLIQLGGSV